MARCAAWRNVPPHLGCAICAYCYPLPWRNRVTHTWILPTWTERTIALYSDLPHVVATVAPRHGEVVLCSVDHHCVFVYSDQGVLLRRWGLEGIAPGQFQNPCYVAVTLDDQVVVADYGNNRVQMFSLAGDFVRMWGTRGSGPGQFKGPDCVAVTPSGAEVVVLDANNHRVQVFRLSDGTFVRQWGSQGTGDGHFEFPATACVTKQQVCDRDAVLD